MSKSISSCEVAANASKKTPNISSILPFEFKQRYSSLFKYLDDVTKELGGEQVFYTLDLANILWKVQLWREKLPNVKIFYAVKANSDPVLLRLLVILGLSFDCATEGEIRLVLKAGGSPDNIIFAHTIKTLGGLNYAKRVGASLMTFDSKEELKKIHSIYPDARLVLRLSPEDIQCVYDLSDKFGCSMEEAPQILSRAKELNMNVVGISFHVGAMCSDPKSYISTIKNCAVVFDNAKQLGFKFTILDIGGGFFGAKGTEEIFCKVADGINEGLRTYFPGSDVEYIAEPGCYMVGSAFTLITTILGKRNVQNHLEKGGKLTDIKRHYYINESIYGSFFNNYEIYDMKMEPLLTESELKKRTVHKTRIFGQTCCSEDVIKQECLLPEMEIGESIIWWNTGAYAQECCTTFCSVPLPVTRYIFQEDSRLNLSRLTNTEEITNLMKNFVILIQNENQMQNGTE